MSDNLSTNSFSVSIGDTEVGTIYQRGDHTRFVISDDYRSRSDRPILGLVFEENLFRNHSRSMELPAWFSNLLPESALRDWIARERGVSVDREMELLAEVGHDLPGAVIVRPEGSEPDAAEWPSQSSEDDVATSLTNNYWRFSLAGVGLKFSMIRENERLTLPARGRDGDWIVKLPDPKHPNVPLNEFAMMKLAALSGIAVPEIKLVDIDELTSLPKKIRSMSGEEQAFAIRRFDRPQNGQRVHIEDLAQVRDFQPKHKYDGNYETAASLVYRGSDEPSLQEFVRRLAFNILIANGDAHLKNWSLIYENPRSPQLSPAYDLVSTAYYYPGPDSETLALKFGGSKRFADTSLSTFARLERKLQTGDIGLVDCVRDLVDRVVNYLPEVVPVITNPGLLDDIRRNVQNASSTILSE